MNTILSVIQVLIAMAMIGIILVQRGPGASAGSGFGAGASGTVFGSRGSGSFLTRSTAVLAAAFFGLSFVMAILASRVVDPTAEQDIGIMQGVVEEQQSDEVPAFQSNEAPAVDLEVPDAGVDAAAEMPADAEVPVVEEGAGAAEVSPDAEVPVVAGESSSDEDETRDDDPGQQ